jgi:dTMP kinase
VRVGRFVSIDGPGGSGKSSLTREVAQILLAAKVDVLPTCEPSFSILGRFVRRSTDRFTGLSLACLVAADRYDHLERVVRPALARGAVVVSDRYVPSSLVLQRMDGVSMEFIADLNREALRPHLAVILTADPAILSQRLRQRGYHSRFERASDISEREVAMYVEAAGWLRREGWNSLLLDTATAAAKEVALIVVDHISALMEDSLFDDCASACPDATPPDPEHRQSFRGAR